MEAEDTKKLPITWTAHRALEQPAKGVISILIIILASFGTAVFMQSALWGIFSVGVLFLGLARFFLPIEYAIDNIGIREKFLGVERVASWRTFKRTIVAGKDVLLSPYLERTMMDRFRAWQVHTPDAGTAKYLAELASKHTKDEAM